MMIKKIKKRQQDFLSLGQNAQPVVSFDVEEYTAVALPTKFSKMREFPLQTEKTFEEGEVFELNDYVPQMVSLVHGQSKTKEQAKKLIRESMSPLKKKSA